MGPKKGHINSDSDSPIKSRRSLPKRSTRPQGPMRDGSDEDNLIAEVTTSTLEKALRESIRTAKKEAGLRSDDDLPASLFEPGPSKGSVETPNSYQKKKRGRPRRDVETSQNSSKQKEESPPKGPRATSTRILYVGPLTETEATDADTESDGSGYKIFGRRSKKKKREQKTAKPETEKGPDFKELLRRASSTTERPPDLSPPRLTRASRAEETSQFDSSDSPPKISPIKPILTKRISYGSESSPHSNKVLKKKITAKVVTKRYVKSHAPELERRRSDESSVNRDEKKPPKKKNTKLRFSKSVTTEIYQRERNIISSEEEEHGYPKRQRPNINYDLVKRRNVIRRKAETDYEKSDFDSDRRSLPNIRITPSRLSKKVARDYDSDSSMPVLSRITSPRPEKSGSSETEEEDKSKEKKEKTESPPKITKMTSAKKATLKRKRSESLPPETPVSPTRSTQRKRKNQEELKDSPKTNKVSVQKNKSPNKRVEPVKESSTEEEEPRARRNLPKVNYSPNKVIITSFGNELQSRRALEVISSMSSDEGVNTRTRSMKNIVKVREARRKKELAEALNRPTPKKREDESDSDSSSLSPRQTRSQKKKLEEKSSSESEGSEPVEHIKARRKLFPVDYSPPKSRQPKAKVQQREKDSDHDIPIRNTRSQIKNNKPRPRRKKDDSEEETPKKRGPQKKKNSTGPEEKKKKKEDKSSESESDSDDSHQQTPMRRFKKTRDLPQRSSSEEKSVRTEETQMPKRKNRLEITLPENPRRPQVSVGQDNYFSSSSEDEKFDTPTLNEAIEMVKTIYELVFQKYEEEMKEFKVAARNAILNRPEKVYRIPGIVKPKPLILKREPIGFDEEVVRVFLPNGEPAGPPVPAHFVDTSPQWPRMKYWVYSESNIRTDDCTRLSHIPYIDDEQDAVAFVRDLKKAYPEGIHGTLKGWGRHISDYLLYRLLVEAMPKWKKTKHDMRYLWNAIYKLFPNKLSARELENIFPVLEDRFEIRLKDPNDTSKREDTGHSVRTMMCVKCVQYHCPLHGVFGDQYRQHRQSRNEELDSGKDLKDNTSDVLNDSKTKDIRPCGKDCYLHIIDEDDSQKESPSKKKRAGERKKKERKGDEEGEDDESKPKLFDQKYQQTFHKLIQCDRNSICQIAKIMSVLEEKTCQEVYRLKQQITVPPDREMSPDDIMIRKLTVKEVQSSFRHFTWNLGGGHVDNSARPRACRHKGHCGRKVKECICAQNESLCTKFCSCGVDCRMRFPGCRCQPGQCRTKQCQCFYAKWECDPDTCKNCNCGPIYEGELEPKKGTDIEPPVPSLDRLSLEDEYDSDDENQEYEESDEEEEVKTENIPKCSNSSIQRGNFKKVKVGKSDIAGFGCFIDEPCEKGELVAEYTGEVITKWEAERRGRIYDAYRTSYIFALNREQSIDATRLGNYMRFANHSSKEANCYSQIIMVNGEHRIGIFAKRKLYPNEELLFDYQYNKKWKAQYCPHEKQRFIEATSDGATEGSKHGSDAPTGEEEDEHEEEEEVKGEEEDVNEEEDGEEDDEEEMEVEQEEEEEVENEDEEQSEGVGSSLSEEGNEEEHQSEPSVSASVQSNTPLDESSESDLSSVTFTLTTSSEVSTSSNSSEYSSEEESSFL